ncbi:MAG TPA: serine hydrolase [Ohtaekwangia sp.]|nr:serine hydrolase [Ohtaekwangia sp.]
MIKKLLGCILAFAGFFSTHAQPEKDRWVDSVFSSMSVNEKIGQIFMIRIKDTDGETLQDAAEKIGMFGVGGVIFQHGSPIQVAGSINQLQGKTATPLLVGLDAVWGLNLDSTISYPRPLSLGAIRNDSMVYDLGKEIARQMKVIGANLNFAPIADVLKRQDTLLAYRSFGENPNRVARKAVAYMKGLQSQGVLPVARHFPIQGLTVMNVDKGIPTIHPTIDSIQAFPYRKLFEEGLTGVIPAAADFPVFYPNIGVTKKNTFNSSILSALFTGDWIRKNMEFRGLVFADVPGVQNFTKKYRSGEAELFAFQAGNDILIDPRDLGPAIRKIKKLVRTEERFEQQLDQSVRKILSAKYDAGLWRSPTLNTDNILRKLNTPQAKLLSQKLYNASVTVVRDVPKVLPLMTLENRHFSYLTDEQSERNKQVYHYLSRYVNFSSFIVGERTDLIQLADALDDQEVIIIGIFPGTPQSIIDRYKRLIPLLPQTRQVVICDFGNEALLKSADHFPTIVTAYTDVPETRKAVPEVLFGALRADGLLPFTAALHARVGDGIQTRVLNRLSHSIPEDAGMDSRVLRKIDAIATEAIRIGATPGCQVLVAKDGKVIYDKTFGYLTYDSITPVTDETIYDLASLTKVSATLQAAMFMYEKGLIDINKKVSYYLPELKKTNKKDLTIIDMLTHQSGLLPFIPLWPQTMQNTEFHPTFYSHEKSEAYPLQVAPDLFATPAIRDSVWTWIMASKLQDRPARTPYSYRYSDLGFMIMHQVAERILNQPMEDFLNQNFYEPLGAHTTGYTPLNDFPAQLIAPTEDDRIYRKTLVSGTVHDERAAMLGGIAGHAGLFSTANDLAKLGQMLLQEGSYGGYQYYKSSTVQMFTHKQFEKSRRGLGWDKPTQSDPNGPTSVYASPQTFGHTGFTGTCMWVDPEFNLVYIFLSNRVFPDRNNKLITSNIRSRIQDVIYQSIFNYCAYTP